MKGSIATAHVRGSGYTALPRVLTGRAISVEVLARLRRPQASIYIVSPYFQDYAFLRTWPLSSLLFQHLSDGTQVTVLTTPPPGKTLEKAEAKKKYQLLRRLSDHGVRILVNDKLHAKIYMFEESVVTKSLILGSANMTLPGMEEYLEIAVASYNRELYESVSRIVVRFERDRDTFTLLRWASAACAI